MLQGGERIDDLNWRNLKIIQNPRWFCFSLDAVLLASFVTLRSGDQVVDLGTGTGVIPLLLYARLKTIKIIGLEIKKEVAEMAQRSMALNQLEENIKVSFGDIKEASMLLGKGKYSLVVSNPPYARIGSGKISHTSIKAVARTEILCTLEDIIREAALLLNTEGRFSLVHRPSRLVDILYLMRDYAIEPKRLRMVHANRDREPNLVLIEGIKNGKEGLHYLPSLFVYQDKGTHSQEMQSIFRGEILTKDW